MSVYIEQTKQSGGQEYVSGMTETVAKLSAQHFNAMATEETKEAMRIASLDANLLVNTNISDLISFATNQIDKANVNELTNTLLDLRPSIRDAVETNDLNLSVNNLAVDTHRKTDTRARTAVSFALVNVLTKNKTSAQILDIENYFRTGVVPKHLDDKGKKILEVITKGPYICLLYTSPSPRDRG